MMAERAMGSRRTAEPILWLLFSAGGVVSALFLPVLVLLFGLAVPLGWLAPGADHLHAVLTNALSLLVLFGVCVLSLFHWAQRFRYTLFDGLKLKDHQRLINLACYTVAVLGSLAVAFVLWQAR
jgi:succinate dehydrogenase subunit D